MNDAQTDAPSAWVEAHAARIPPASPVLDLACGKGRHTRYALNRGHPVTAVDIAIERLAISRKTPGLEAIAADLEGAPWPLPGRTFGGVIVTNYLYRPILPAIVAAVAVNGVLIYETFGAGNEAFGKPSNPDFLLNPGELVDAVMGELEIIAYGHGYTDEPKPAVRQRIAAYRPPWAG